MRRMIGVLALALASALSLSACGGGDPLNTTATQTPESGGGTAKAGKVVVGSANFPGSVLIGSIYSQALRAKGVEVEEKFNIGSREIYYDQVKSGGLTIMPEYIGSLLAYVDKSAPTGTKEQTVEALKGKLPAELAVLTPAAAEDNDSLTVTKATADKHKLTSIEDLAAVAKDFAVGGPPEFKTRQEQRLKDVYGLEFKEWEPTGETTADALKSGTIQVGNVFTADPKLAAGDLVALKDTKAVFGSNNIAPLVHKAGVGEAATAALDAVSAKLDTAALLGMMKRVAIDKDDPPTVAKEWLVGNGLL
ncbi:osmoprotectant transport system substrate-binding protein [Sinosporangium album]|uniref:Osmoprotectant transport system substrate-binding protein n=1 Tax=Sinosporangium album TaxID=504805 RepID=A0A1G8F3W2_9ACTN|nr:ABC transporter substrate-binding protein [Sinosporangium album]SDH76767.1 osmoprotectant transport system substrate-binding protein [Sinosporangium album]